MLSSLFYCDHCHCPINYKHPTLLFQMWVTCEWESVSLCYDTRRVAALLWGLRAAIKVRRQEQAQECVTYSKLPLFKSTEHYLQAFIHLRNGWAGCEFLSLSLTVKNISLAIWVLFWLSQSGQMVMWQGNGPFQSVCTAQVGFSYIIELTNKLVRLMRELNTQRHHSLLGQANKKLSH